MKSLTRDELDRLLAAAGSDALMFRVIFNHGLRVSEVIALTDANVIDGHLVVQRLKGSKKTTQPLLGDERELLTMKGVFFPMCRMTVWRRIQAAGAKADIPKHKLFPHALKHTCGRLGFKGGMTIPDIQAYLGHVNGGNTLVYMQSSEEEAAQAFAAAVGK
jgi:integrase/recombinase XerD